LGRIKHTQGIHLEFLSEVEAPLINPPVIEEIMLFRSEPQPDGSKYTVIDRIPLQGNSKSTRGRASGE